MILSNTDSKGKVRLILANGDVTFAINTNVMIYIYIETIAVSYLKKRLTLHVPGILFGPWSPSFGKVILVPDLHPGLTFMVSILSLILEVCPSSFITCKIKTKQFDSCL